MAGTDVTIVHNGADWAAVLARGAVVAFFHANWCPHCRSIGPVFEELSGEFASLVFASVDFDEAGGVARDCGVQFVPVFQVWRDGRMVDQHQGDDRDALRAFIARNGAMLR